ncbi:MAG: regulator, partial [Selenomonas sp.]|nr:regulator [Selenomonas sp.]
MQVIHTNNAPAAVGPYSQAIKAGNTLYLSGQIAINPAAGKIVATTIEEQAEQCCKNIEAVLQEAGTDMSRVVKTTCFLAEIAD